LIPVDLISTDVAREGRGIWPRVLVLTLFIITTINIEEKSIQQHGKGYIVPSKNNYRLDKMNSDGSPIWPLIVNCAIMFSFTRGIWNLLTIHNIIKSIERNAT
jgi:hypothetical protein